MNTHKIIMIAVALSVAAFAFIGFTANTTISNGYDIGDVATDFSLKNIDNQKVSLADFKNAKGYIVIFSCNTCPYVVAYEDRMIALHNKYNPKGYPVIAINPNDPDVSPGDSFEKMQERARDKQFPFPYLFDETQESFWKYGATRTPHVFLLEKTDKGNIVRYIGAIDDNYKDASAVKEKFIENAVDALLSGNDIAPKTTKAIGCTIKFKE